MIDIINYDITNACAYKCKGCYRVAGRDREWFGFDLLRKSMREAKALGAEYTGFSGGEPGMVPDRLLRCLEIGKEEGFLGQGVLTSGYNIDAWWEKGRDLITFLQVSLDGDREYHNWYRGHPDAFDNAMHAIDLGEEWVSKNRRTEKRYGRLLRVNMVATNRNLKDLDFLLKLASERMIELRISPIVPLGGYDNSGLVMDVGDVALLLGRIGKVGDIFARKGKTIDFAPPEPDGKFHKVDLQFGLVEFSEDSPFNCPSGRSAVDEKNLGRYPVINDNGDVKFCNYYPWSAGNIKDKDFTEIYEHPENMEKFFDAKPLNMICKNCIMRGICIQVCRSFAYMMDGVFDYPTIESIPKRCLLRKYGLLEKRTKELCQSVS